MDPLTHWSDAWLGRPWVAGRFECVDLVAAVTAELGLAPRLAGAIPAGWRTAGPARRAELLEAVCRRWSLARRLGADEAPRDGDGVVLRRPGARRAHHVGVRCAPNGGPARHVLHCHEPLGAVRQAPAALATAGWVIDSTWRWTP